MIFANSWVFFALVALLILASLREYFGMLEVGGIAPWRNAVLCLSALYIAGLFWRGHFHGAGSPAAPVPGLLAELEGLALAVVTGVVFALQMTRRLEGRDTIVRLMATVFGFVYLPFLFGFVVKILYLPGVSASGAVQGQFYALFLIAVTKFTDMGAYIVGSLIGRHKMIPHISPKKTWEGFGGAFAFALLASFGIKSLCGPWIPLITWTHAAALAFLIGLAAIVGDLAESVLKRSWHTKDSGRVLPGIGGTLDLIDSICFCAPVMYFYLRLIA
jgi:phosphatidate cytidylyltransferase